MSKRTLCKFFAHGACLKGEYCEFSHDWKDPPNNICTFYQKGVCSYGSRCRYDHVKVSGNQTSVPSSSSRSHAHLGSIQTSNPSGFPLDGQAEISSLSKPAWSHNFPEEDSSSLSEYGPLHLPRSIQPSDLPICSFAAAGNYNVPEEDSSSLSEYGPLHLPRSVQPSDLPICSFAAAGSCPYGEQCPHIHGDLCTICGKQCLHPYRPDEREEHIKLCQKNSKRLEALKHSQEIECSVCLDRVLSKPTVAERKFGLLSDCDHPFCISCIRSWRSNSPASGMDVNSALRACPICRKLSYFVIPSVIWYASKEDKEEIIDSYKAKLRSIDCRYFDFGNGTCPFGTSCFYKHAYRDGRLEEVVLRHLDAEDGNTVIAKNIRLSDFLGRLHL